MTTTHPCPIPQVHEALKPYIRSRQEISRIRQALTTNLTSTLPKDHSLSQVALGSIPKPHDDNLPSEGVSFVANTASLQAQYIQALLTHRKAQARYLSAKEGLKDLQDEGIKPSTPNYLPTKGKNGIVVNEYLATLRSQRSQSRADAVLHALDRLGNIDPHPAHVEIKTTVRELLGEAPAPPSSGGLFSGDGYTEKVDVLVSKIKRAVVKARAAAEEAQRDRERSEKRIRNCVIIHGEVDAFVRKGALERARDEVHGWIEGELSKVSERDDEEVDDGDVATEEDGQGRQMEEISKEVINERVEEMYGRYIEARKELLHNVESALKDSSRQIEEQDKATEMTPTNSTPSSPSVRRRNTLQSTTSSSISAVQLLPHLPTLINTARTSASVLQQSTFLRRTIQNSTTTTTSAIQRLAGESHLVAPDAISIDAWTHACKEASGKTEDAVREHVIAGRASIERAGGELDEWRARREAVGRVKGDSGK